MPHMLFQLRLRDGERLSGPFASDAFVFFCRRLFPLAELSMVDSFSSLRRGACDFSLLN